VRQRPESALYGHISRADERQVDEPDPQSPATRADVEELRRRIDRLESLTDNEE